MNTAKNHNITNYKIYEDRQTGSNLDRPSLKKLQNDIFRGQGRYCSRMEIGPFVP